MLHENIHERIATGVIAGKAAPWQVALLLAFCLLYSPASARADEVTDWNAIAVTAAVTNAGKGPPASVVDLAYMHAAMYDAVNAIDGRYSVYAVRPSTVPPDASKAAAAVAAAYNILRVLFPTQLDFLGARYAASLGTIPDGLAKDHGVAVGEEVAALFLASRAGDGRNASITYTPGSGPGAWQPTPPALAAAQTPWVAQMRPFAIESPSQYRAEGPPALTSAQWAADFNETKNLGAAGSTTRTAEQTEIGRFYAEHTGAQYARIFRDFAAEQGMSLADNARLFAVLYVTLADALIACWDSKYHFGFWRPVTAIRAADTDDNPATDADPAWAPLAPTPNHPEYPAAHGAFTGAYAEALRRFFASKHVTITLTSTVTGTARTFSKTEHLINEIIEARIYGGMHFRTSSEHGVEMGKKVAKWVAKHHFKAVE
jgi:hypothetical protein